MRFREFEPILEGGSTGLVRYNSEVGMLYGLIGDENTPFDPKRPELSLPAKLLGDSESVYKDIKKLLVPNFDQKVFDQWAQKGRDYKNLIIQKLNAEGATINGFGWSGGKNKSDVGVADISFVGSDVQGISIKAEGGITLANLTPKSLGLETERGKDIFNQYASKEYVSMKTQIFKDALAAAKAQPNKPLIPIKEKYSLTYDSAKNSFIVEFKGKKVPMTEQDILSKVEANSPWQRVFGDYFQANWQTKKSYAAPLYKKIAKVFEVTIENHLRQSGQLLNMMRFGKQPYFYASTTGLYFVPTAETIGELQIKGLRYAEPDGTSQRFIALVGRPDSETNAEMDVYIRYANGMFESNPTVRVQSLKNPNFIGWEKLS